MYKHILKAIGNGLLLSGNCPYDAACPFGRGTQCSAPSDVLELKKKAITDRINGIPKCLAFEVTVAPSPWHCENIGAVHFVDPD